LPISPSGLSLSMCIFFSSGVYGNLM
jgi:hypothetical protein